MKLTRRDRPGIAVGYWKARNSPSRARLSGDSLRMSRPFQMDLAARDHVRRVAHQRVGERRLARAVGAHDRVDLALADGQVDALQDLVVGAAMGATRRPRIDRAAGRRRCRSSRVGRDSLEAVSAG